MSTLIVFSATDLEFGAIASQLSQWRLKSREPLGGVGWFGQNRIELFRTEMGPQNAAKSAKKILKHSTSQFVLVSGFAGALSTQCQVGDVVFYRQCGFLRDSQELVGCDRSMIKRLREQFQVSSFTVHEGLGLTSSSMFCRSSEKLENGKKHNALAVDMESFQIIREANQAGRQVAVLRIISDDALHNLPDLNAALSTQTQVNYFRMLLSLSAHPVLSARFLFNLKKSVSYLKQATRLAFNARLS